MDKTYKIIVDVPQPGILHLTLCDKSGTPVLEGDFAYEGHVDNYLLTAVDNLVQGSSIDRSALTTAEAGPGIDKDSALGRIVTSFASALGAANQAVGR